MNKKKQAAIIVLTIFIFIFTILLVDGLFFANKLVRAKSNIIESAKISEQLDGFKILYFSDVQYNLFVDEKRLLKIVNQINQQKPDLVLLGGDLIDFSETPQLDQEQISTLIDALSLINAPYGKFSVSGTQEQSSDYASTTTAMILQMAEFEIVDDKLFRIYYNNDYINLIGIKSQEVTKSLTSLDSNKYTLAFTHAPMNADLVSSYQIDLTLAGFTHGGQINVPGFARVFFDNQPYVKSSQKVNHNRLDISNGVGTEKIDFRLFADGDILVYTLRSIEP